VERLREGRSYTTRSVKAVQDGQVVFILLCSFQRPEPWQPGHQWKMPANVPPPDECELEEVRFIRSANEPGQHEKYKSILLEVAAVSFHIVALMMTVLLTMCDQLQERSRSPIRIKNAKEHVVSENGVVTYMYWMQARNIPAYDAPFQKVRVVVQVPLSVTKLALVYTELFVRLVLVSPLLDG
jgi:acyl-CoA thioesterase II